VDDPATLEDEIVGVPTHGDDVVRGPQSAPQSDHPATLLTAAWPVYVVSGLISVDDGLSVQVAGLVATLPARLSLPSRLTTQETLVAVGFMYTESCTAVSCTEFHVVDDVQVGASGVCQAFERC
jgi:hypothetical protein